MVGEGSVGGLFGVSSYSLSEAAGLAGVSEEVVLGFVREGLVECLSSVSGEVRFDDGGIRVLRRVVFLVEVEGVGLDVVRLIVLLDREVELLRETVRFYRDGGG